MNTPDVIEQPKAPTPVACSDLLAAGRPNSMAEDSRMLDHLLEVQRILTRNKDHKRLALLHPLTDSLQDEYLGHLERIVKGG